MSGEFDTDWRARSKVEHSTRARLAPMIAAHYLGKWPAVVPCKLAMVIDGHDRGMVVWAYPPRETMKRYGGMTWELARLWIDDGVPKNAETWLIGQAVRHIRKEHPQVKVLVSYADPSANHSGVIYRAANWTEDGMTDQERKTPRFDYLVDGVRYSRKSHVPNGANWERVPRVSKHRFVYRLTAAQQEKEGEDG